MSASRLPHLHLNGVPAGAGPGGRRQLCADLSSSLAGMGESLARREDDPVLTAAFADLSVQIGRAIEALEEAPSLAEPGIDAARFHRLLEIAGPETAAELVQRLQLDLAGVRERLGASLDGPEPDWAELRAQTHVLVGLAGAVGADRVQHLAETLNAAAHRRNRDAAEALAHDLLPPLDRLIDYVARQAGPAP